VGGECSTGVARVETKHTVIDGLLAVVTGGIFTPMTYLITGASRSAMTPDTIQLHVAPGTARRSHGPRRPRAGAVYVQF
jgi:hypothetical protein